MRQILKNHPDSGSIAASRIEVDIAWPHPGNLTLRYLVSGKTSDLKLPPTAAPERTDELWRGACFEAFLRPSTGAAYYEFNFSPSTQWAAYRFTGYRSGRSDAMEIEAPRIEVTLSERGFELRASLTLDGETKLPSSAAWRLGLSAVIEDMRGGKSYWALAHAPGKPDFHHSDCFAYQISARDHS